MINYLRLIRIEQWVKNIFMILPLFFAGKLFDTQAYLPLLTGMICFSFTSSAIYIINDYLDCKEDKLHPQKCNRPLASGVIKKGAAAFLMLLFLAVSLTTAYFLNIDFFYILIFYFILNLLYSIKLKQIPILDVSIIAMGFIFRIQGGGLIADIVLSKWLIIITFLLALFLGLAKRRDDVLIYNNNGTKMRKSIQGYNLDFINLSMMLMAGVIVVSYIMYTTSEEIELRLGSTKVYLTTLFVLLGLLRYLQISLVELNSGSPTKILLKDRFIQLTIIGWIVSFYLILYKMF